MGEMTKMANNPLTTIKTPQHLKSTPPDLVNAVNSMVKHFNHKIKANSLSDSDIKNYRVERDELIIFIQFTTREELRKIWPKITKIIHNRYDKDKRAYHLWLLIKYYISYLTVYSDWDELSEPKRDDAKESLIKELIHLAGRFERFDFKTKSGWYWKDDEFEVLSKTSGLELKSISTAKALCGPSIPSLLNRVAAELKESKPSSPSGSPYIKRSSSNRQTNRFRAFIHKAAKRNEISLGKPYPSLISDIATFFFKDENNSPDKIRLVLKAYK